MAKVNPVMQHAKPVKTKEQVAVEDFMNTIPPAVVETPGGLVDNTPVEWVQVPDASLDPIIESAVVADNLDELATDVDGITTAASMESYKRIFMQTLELSGHPLSEGVSVESFKATRGGKRALAKTIRDQATRIRGCVAVALEGYAEETSASIDTTFKAFQQALSELDSKKSKVHVPDEEVTVNHKSVWQMLHIDNEFLDDPGLVSNEVQAIREVSRIIAAAATNVKSIADNASGGTALDKEASFNLLFNETLTIDRGRATLKRKTAPGMPKEWSAGDIGWIAFWGIFFTIPGLVLATTYRAVKGGSGKEKPNKQRSTKQMHQFIDELRKLGPICADIEKSVKEIEKVIKAAPEEHESDVKRVTAPTLELAQLVMKHCTEVVYGANTLFDKVS